MEIQKNDTSIDQADAVKSGPYADFETDKKAEAEGVEIDYGSYWFKIARTGGANTRYSKRINAVFKPYRRQIQTDTMKEELADKLVREVFVETAIISGGSKMYGQGAIQAKDGSRMDLTPANLNKLFTDLPDLYNDLREQAGKVSLFRTLELEEDAKN